MYNKSKTFAIYCSAGASRVLKFYSYKGNLNKFKPEKVIYDGEGPEVIDSLKGIFGEDLILFNKNSKHFNPNRIHSSTSEFIETIMAINSIEYLLCFGDKLFKKKIIEKYEKQLINFHPSLLPAFKGLMSLDQALDYGVSLIGNTAHFIDEGVDTGQIIIQTAMLAEDVEDFEDVLEMQFPMLKIIFRDILKFDISQEEIFKEIEHRDKKFLIPKSANCGK